MGLIQVAEGFTSAINIAYDLFDTARLKNYIPTREGLTLLLDILRSTRAAANNQDRILVGAYGKGKSYLVLMILSILLQRDRTLFVKMNQALERDFPDILYEIDGYYANGARLLPVVITETAGSLSQAFLLALQRALHDFSLGDLLPHRKI